jgi:hypothetical protein
MDAALGGLSQRGRFSRMALPQGEPGQPTNPVS